MNGERVNEILRGICEKESITKEEKKALMIACTCVWKTIDKVEDEKTFYQMLENNMIMDYDVETKVTEKETEFLIKTFKS